VLGSTLLSVLLAQAPAKIAVLDLERSGVDAQVAETLSLLIPTQVRAAAPHAQVVSAAEVQSMLGFERQKQLAGCSDNTACMAEIGLAMGATEIVTGKLGKVGQTFILELRRLDTRQGRSVGSATRVVKGAVEKLVDEVPGAVTELFGKSSAEPPTPAAPVEAVTPSPPREHPGWALWTLGGGAVLVAGGAAGAIWAGTVAQQVSNQQSGGSLTVTRADARTAQTVYAASWTVGLVGLAAVGAGVWGYYWVPGSAHVALAPTPGGMAAAVGGTF
jgi:hypothetical protein